MAVKAWGRITFPGGTPTLVAGGNVASLTDNGDGDVTVNFTSNLSTTTFGVTFGALADVDFFSAFSDNPALGSVRLHVGRAGVPTDYAFCFSVVE